MFGKANSPRALRKLGLVSVSALGLVCALGLGCSAEYSRGPAPSNETDPDALLPDVVAERQSPAGALRVGFAKRAYTPTLVDTQRSVSTTRLIAVPPTARA